MVANAEPDGEIKIVEVLGVNLYAIKLDEQSVGEAIEHDNRQWFAVSDIAFVRTSGIPSDKLAGWSKPFVPPKGRVRNYAVAISEDSLTDALFHGTGLNAFFTGTKADARELAGHIIAALPPAPPGTDEAAARAILAVVRRP